MTSSLIDSRDYRRTIGLFATGVTVLATEFEGKPHGMTANAVSSVSLDPLLVLVCVNVKQPMVEYLRAAKGFSINILRETQEPLSNYFAQMWKEPTPPPHQFVPWMGGPRLEGCIASLGCELHDIVAGGDHWIIIGRVLDLHHGPEPYRPLLFYSGQYERLPLPALAATP